MGGRKKEFTGWLVGVVVLTGGCNRAITNGLLDPSQVGSFSGPNKPQTIQNVVSIMDEPLDVAAAAEPAPEDLEVIYKDYALGPGDIIDLVIYELFAEGTQTPLRLQLSETGYVSIPELGVVELAGLTTREVEERISDLLRPIIRRPRVTVLLADRRHQMFHAIGGFDAPGTYPIMKPDFRLLDAISLARNLQLGIETIYVIRTYETAPPVAPAPPPAEAPAAVAATVAATQTMPTEAELQQLMPGGTLPALGEGTGLTRPIYVNGQWVEVPVAPTGPGTASGPAAATQEEAPPPAAHEGWMAALAEGGRQRILRVPVRELLRGDPRYNIVVRPGDKIYAWVGPVGEFYVMGNVNVPGVYSLTGRRVTVVQGVAAARGLGPLAWPNRCELIRRHTDDVQEIIHLDLDAIFAGTQPDVLLKPNDVINVGTTAVAPFLATVRNAFRMTYGFGFVYDRNFADIDSYGGRANPEEVRRAKQAQRFGFLFR